MRSLLTCRPRRALLERALLASFASAVTLASLAAPACVLPSISTGSGGDAGATSATASGDGGTTATAVQGASCTQITQAISLCEYISACPDLVLNPKVFPQCGFRIHGSAIDPECLCGNYLCPIGNPTTCAEATQDSSGDVTYDSVCQAQGTGGCLDLSASGGSSTTSACQSCIAACDNVPSCIDACQC